MRRTTRCQAWGGSLRSLINTLWKPRLKNRQKLVEGGVVATVKPDGSRQLLEQGRRQHLSVAAEGLPRCLLRIGRLGLSPGPKTRIFEPRPKLVEVAAPSQRTRHVSGRAPDPGLQLGRDDNGFRATLPTIAFEPEFDFLLDLFPRSFAATSLMIENNKRPPILVDERAQELDRLGSTTRIGFRVSTDVERYRAYAQIGSALPDQDFQRDGNVLVRRQHNELRGLSADCHRARPPQRRHSDSDPLASPSVRGALGPE